MPKSDWSTFRKPPRRKIPDPVQARAHIIAGLAQFAVCKTPPKEIERYLAEQMRVYRTAHWRKSWRGKT